MKNDGLSIIQSDAGLVADVRSMITQTRKGVARTINAGMTLLYWSTGRRIQAEVLQDQQAEYGKDVLATLSQQLTGEFGKGFSYSALTRMVQFAENLSEPYVPSSAVTLLSNRTTSRPSPPLLLKFAILNDKITFPLVYFPFG